MYPTALPTIRCIGINQGELSKGSVDLSELLNQVTKVCEYRYKLVMVMVGSARWARRDEYSRWIFTEYCFDYMWPWLFVGPSFDQGHVY